MVQCWSNFYNAGTTSTHQWMNVSCLLGYLYRKGSFFFTIILFYRISQFISLHVMTNGEINNSLIFRIALSLHFEMPVRYQIKNYKSNKMFFKKITKIKRAKTMIYITEFGFNSHYNFQKSGESVLMAGQRLRCWPTLKSTILI